MIYEKPGRISSAPVIIESGVQVTWSDDSRVLTVKGGNNSFEIEIVDSVTVELKDSEILFHANQGFDGSKSLAGTYRSIADNAVKGIKNPWERKLIFEGVGYKVMPGSGKNSVALNVGYSNPVQYSIDPKVNFEITDNNRTLVLKCFDKQVLGQVAAEIRSKRPPNRYSGKGIRYFNEVVDQKEVSK